MNFMLQPGLAQLWKLEVVPVLHTASHKMSAVYSPSMQA